MRLNAPSKLTFWISLVLVVVGVVSTFVAIPFVSAYAFWVVLAGYIVLAIGATMKGM